MSLASQISDAFTSVGAKIKALTGRVSALEAGGGSGASDTIPVAVNTNTAAPYTFNSPAAGSEIQFAQSAPLPVVFNAIVLPAGARGLIRNTSGQKLTFQACPANTTGRLRVAAMMTASNSLPTLPSGFTAFSPAVNGVVLGTAVTTASDPDTFAIPAPGILMDTFNGGSVSAADIDAVSYTATQTLTMPATFTPAGASAAANSEVAFLFVAAMTSASGVTALDFPTPNGWFLMGKRIGFRSTVALYQKSVNAGAVVMPSMGVTSDGPDGALVGVSAALLVTKPTILGAGATSGSAAFSDTIPRPGGAILKSTKATPAMSVANAMATWSLVGNTVYLNGELDP